MKIWAYLIEIKYFFLSLALILITNPVDAAFVKNYGDFAGDKVSYREVTEKNICDSALYGPPNDPVLNDMLTFATMGGFRAEAPSVGSDAETTSGRLEFLLDGEGQTLQELVVVEGGDYGWAALPGSSSLVSATLNIRVFDADRQTLLLSDNVIFTDNLISATNPTVFVDDWALSTRIDLSSLDITQAFVVINNNLAAVVDGPSTAFIEKKNFKVTGVVPEPDMALMLGLGAAAFVLCRQRPNPHQCRLPVSNNT